MKKLALFVFSSLFLVFQSCHDGGEYKPLPENQTTFLQQISFEDLSYMDNFVKGFLASFNVQLGLNANLDDFDLQERIQFVQSKGFSRDSIYVDAYKVSYQEQHPNSTLKNKVIYNSGTLLLPSRSLLPDGKTCKLIVVSPGAYSDNKEASTLVYKDRESLMNQPIPANQFSSFFNNLLALEGFAVLIPDYPGYGDSFNQCIHPLLQAKPMANSLVNLMTVTCSKMTELKFDKNEGIILSGYSLGAYVSGLAGKQIEQTQSELNLDLLIIGGTPTDLTYLAKQVQKNHDTAEHLVFPWAVMVYENNGYPNLNVDDVIIKDKQLIIGQYIMSGDISATEMISLNLLPEKSVDFYAPVFRADSLSSNLGSRFQYLEQVLVENSFTPWKNKVKFKMLHAQNDITCYYAPALKFAEEINKMGGNISFETANGEHLMGAVVFYQRLLENAMEYK